MIFELLSVLSLVSAISASTPVIVAVDSTDDLNYALVRLQTGMRVEVAEGLYELDNPICMTSAPMGQI